MSSRTQAFVLLLFGAALLRLGAGTQLLRFVRASARPWVLAAGAVVVVLAVWSLVADARADAEDGGPAGASAVDAHGHRPATRLAWLVLAPVIALVVIGPPALGAFSADRQRSSVAVGQPQHYDPLPAGNPVPVALYDFAVRGVLGGGRSLRGRTVRTVGFVARGAPHDFVLARLVITCCAADASPVFVRVRAAGATVPVPRNRWIEVVGTFTGIDPHSADLPVLRASTVRPVAAPANPYG